jgi:predicted nucleotidyltransferase
MIESDPVELEHRGSEPPSEGSLLGPLFEKQSVDRQVFLQVLDDVVRAIEGEEIPYVFVGGVASAVLGRARWTLDLDVLIRPNDVDRTLRELEDVGFDTAPYNVLWLYKAAKNGVVVDVLIRSTGDIYLDEEMLERSSRLEFEGRELAVAPPEDIILMKALAYSEDTPRYWFDALSILARCDLDWDYLVRRARLGPRRILSLLFFAQANDLAVPEEPIVELLRTVMPPADRP